MTVVGVVKAFDEHVGLGDVEAKDGRVLPFHCTQIADGTRNIAVGTRVTFEIVVDRPKGPEAWRLVSR